MTALLSTTKRMDKVQFIEVKKSIITHVLANFKYPSHIMKLVNTGPIPVIPLPTFTMVMKEYGFTNANELTI